MQTGSIELAKKALVSIEGKLENASAAQLAVVYGVMRDKERLDAGEPTEIHGHLHVHEIQSIDRLAERLSRALVERKRESPE